jgi:hypothetical protein
VNTPVPFVLDHPLLDNVTRTIRQHKIFPEPPRVAFRKSKSFKGLLVRAAISASKEGLGNAKGIGIHVTSLAKNRNNTEKFYSRVSGEEYTMFYNVNFKSNNTINLFECAIVVSNTPMKQYSLLINVRMVI